MKLTDDQIRAIMQKHITCKTILADKTEVDSLVEKHISEGWEVANKIDCGNKIKITFRKLEKA